MNIQKPIWKVPIATKDQATPDKFFKVFSTWIPESPEVFIDVADYSHITDGPLTYLIGHYCDYALDNSDNELGILYRRKRDLKGTNQEKLQTTLKEALEGFERLAGDQEFSGKLELDKTKLQLIINDRALAPNTEDTWNSLKPDLDFALDQIFKSKKHSTKYQSKDPRDRFSVNIKIK